MEINDISIAISRKLQEAFGSGYKKYMDEVPQNFATPCFFIQFLSLEHIRKIGGRWRVTPLFNVQYFPRNGASESANMVSLPVLVIFFFSQKYMTSGLTSGGVKG